MTIRIFDYGFRSQFFLAGAAAVIFIPVWAWSFVDGTGIGSGWPPTLWHAHEMLFGFISSAVAGFLLTAVPSWTGQKAMAGFPLIVLAAAWIGARAMIATSTLWPLWWTAGVDLAFLPMLAAMVVIPLVRSRNRNLPLVLVVIALWLTNVVFHIALAHQNPPLARQSLVVGIDITLLMVTMIGGRIVPAFTSSALRLEGDKAAVDSKAGLTAVALVAMLAVVVSDLTVPDSHAAGFVAAFGALTQMIRVLQWKTLRTLRQPIDWILHLAYWWLPVGLALKAAALLGGYGIAAFWIHALTIGALTTMITAVMTRASLGHTGRTLKATPLITLAYALLTMAAVVRVFGLALFGGHYVTVIATAAICWTAAFAIFIAVYGPILCGPRVDGKPG